MRILSVILAVSLLLSIPLLGTPSQTAPPEQPAPSESIPQKTTFDFYGYLKLDASYDEGSINSGNFARWTESPTRVPEEGHFNLTARQSRLGLHILAPPMEGFRLKGRVEVDFYGGGGENKNLIVFRHGFMTLHWLDSGWTLLAGQTSDLISPLVPNTVNYPVAWWAGNIGFRRPQLRLTKTLKNSRGESSLALAFSRTVGTDYSSIEPGDSGADSETPAFQFRIGHSWVGSSKPTLGISGHFGREDLRELGDFSDNEVDTWSLGLDFKTRLGERLTLKTELWTGENLDEFLGGIAQGINPTTGEAVESHGGWVALEWTLNPQWSISLGTGLDDPDDQALAPGDRSRNRSLWINAYRSFRRFLKVGFEISHWETDYVGLETGDSLRAQGTLIYHF